MEQLVYRYALPGLPASVLLYILALSKNWVPVDGSSWVLPPEIIGIPILIAISLTLGYFIQQAWMVVFEFSCWRYDSNNRLALRTLNKSVQSQTVKNHIARSGLYSLWDTMLYSKLFPADIGEKDRRMWHSFHTNWGNAIGSLVGAAPIVGSHGLKLALEPYSLTMILLLTGMAIVLITKAFRTKRMVERMEVFWIDSLYKLYEGKLDKRQYPLDIDPAGSKEGVPILAYANWTKVGV